MSLSDELASALGDIRNLSARYKSGDAAAFDAFRDLISRLLHATVLAETSAVRLSDSEGSDRVKLSSALDCVISRRHATPTASQGSGVELTEPYPACHLQLRGTLIETGDVERVHFPTHRVSLEAVVRLLIEEFNVPTRTPAEFWRPLLAESEAIFLDIAHQSLSGPEQ